MASDIREPFPTGRLLPYAAFTGALGFLPIPVVDDWTASLARGAMLRRIARHHGKTIEGSALRTLSRHAAPTPTLHGRAALKAASFLFRRAFLVVNAASAADEALHTFVLGHLFNRYLDERHGDASEVSDDNAQSLQAALNAGVRDAARGMLRDVFLQSMIAGGEALADLPQSLRRTMRAMEGVRDEDSDDGNGLTATFLGRVQQALTDCTSCYLKDVDAAFERALPKRRAPASTTRRRKDVTHAANGAHAEHTFAHRRHRAATTTH